MTKKEPKPHVFVGSSAESLRFAYAIQENLEPHDAFVKVWPQGVFEISGFGLDSLLEAVRSHDFGVFVFAPDDLITIRQRKYSVVRDNVLFELGLFMGRLGRERTFVIVPSGQVDLHLPSDLLGWTMASYDASRIDAAAAMGVACNKVRLAIQRQGRFRADSSIRHVFSAASPIEASPAFKSLIPAKRRGKAVDRTKSPAKRRAVP